MITIGFQAPKRAVVPACLTSPLWCIFFLVWATFFLKGADLVLPAGLDNKDGNLSGGFQLNNQRLQQAFSGSLFTSAPSSALEIYELRLRVDPNSVPFSATPEFEIRMSTTSQDPDFLNVTWSANTGPNESVVLPRSRVNLAGNPGLSFDVVIPLPNHFVYTPSQGSLLVDLTMFDPTGLNTRFDYQSVASDGVSSIAGTTGTIRGNPSLGGFVTRVGYLPVPEPSAVSLLSFALGCMFFSSPVKRTSQKSRSMWRTLCLRFEV